MNLRYVEITETKQQLEFHYFIDILQYLKISRFYFSPVLYFAGIKFRDFESRKLGGSQRFPALSGS